MERLNMTKEEIINLINNNHVDCYVRKYKTVPNLSSILVPYEDVYDQMEYDYFDGVKILTKDLDYIRNSIENAIQYNITEQSLKDKLKEFKDDLANLEDSNETISHRIDLENNIEFLEDFLEDFNSRMESIVDNLMDEINNEGYVSYSSDSDLTIIVDDFGFGDPCLEDILSESRDEEMEGLSYWTIYWSEYDGKIDVEAAEKAGLIAFEYNDRQYLALGGCGMDLSPKLDAYIAFTRDRIPENSKFFSDRNYFNHVVGAGNANAIDNRIKMDKEKYVINVY